MDALTRVLLAPVALFGLTACGIDLAPGFEGTEMFRYVDLTGPRQPGAELTVRAILDLAPPYPSPVEVGCFYATDVESKVDFHDRGVRVGSRVLEPLTDTQPGDEIERIELSFTFRAPEPGDYFLACLTPAAPDNGLGLTFKIRAD